MATHDYVIANQSGAAFRTDLNNALAAIVSNNSNSSSPATTYAYQWWADTANNILKIRNSANNAWIELLQLDGTLTLEDGSASAPALAFRDDLNTGIFSAGADTFNVATGGTERLEISGSQTIFNDAGAAIDFRIESDTKTHMFFMDTSANAIGINTSAPACMLHITDTGAGGDGVLENIRLNSSQNNTNDGNKIQFTRVNGVSGSISCVKVASNNTTDMIFGTRSFNVESESMRLLGDGKLLLGHTSSQFNMKLGIAGTDGGTSGISASRFSNNTSPATLLLSKSRGTSVGSYTVVQDDDQVGSIDFRGADGTDNNSKVAEIKACIDGTPGSNDMPGRLQFHTTADGAATTTQRMVIDSSGRVGIGTGNPGANLEIFAANNGVTDPLSAGQRLRFRDNDSTSTTGQPMGTIEWFSNDGGNSSGIAAFISCVGGDTSGSGDLVFGTGNNNGSERFRVNKDGDFLIGTSSTSNAAAGSKFFEDGKLFMIHRGDSTAQLFLNKLVGSSGAVATFAIATATKGQISVSSTGTTYAVTSDYRLKENVVSISDGITKLKQLLPKRFNFIADETNTLCEGFLAHEVSSIVPNAVTGKKDAVDKDGNIDPQQLDQSKLVPLLVAAVQEIIGKVEALEAA